MRTSGIQFFAIVAAGITIALLVFFFTQHKQHLISDLKTVQGDDLKAGEERDYDIADGLKMKFCWIPAGKAILGSPESEEERYDDEFEHEFVTNGFWLGKYEVTQEEWKAVMGDNPSCFKIDGQYKSRLEEQNVRDTTRFPVENVSWNDCQAFLSKLDKNNQIEKVFGKKGRFCLPHEDAWEYACRGGRGNKQPFYWGNELNGTQANCFGTFPYGTDKAGPYLGRTCAVDDEQNGTYEKHPWGLCHMLGNVLELCECREKEYVCIARGGCRSSQAVNCRSARRFCCLGKDEQLPDYGFRVCVSLE